MRILHLTYQYWPPEFGGELLNCMERHKSLVERGHAVIVFTSGVPNYPRYEICDGIQIFRSPLLSSNSSWQPVLFNVWIVWKLLKCKCEVAQIGDLGEIEHVSRNSILNKATSIFNGILSVLRNTIVKIMHWKEIRTYMVISLADTPDEPLLLSGLSAGMRKQFLQAVDHVVAVSPAIKAALIKKVPRANSVLIPYGIQDELFLPYNLMGRDVTRTELHLNPKDVVFSFIGMVSYRKGFDLLAQVFSELSVGHPDWKLLVIGPNKSEQCAGLTDEEVQQVTEPVRGNTHALFIGRVNDRSKIAAYLAASDVFVFPSRREGMGIAPLEAMSVEIPVIIARLPGITDQANIDGETGFYIPSDDLYALKAAMLKLGSDKNLRKHMGQKGRETIVSRFGWSHFIDQWEMIYQGVKPGVIGNVSDE